MPDKRRPSRAVPLPVVQRLHDHPGHAAAPTPTRAASPDVPDGPGQRRDAATPSAPAARSPAAAITPPRRARARAEEHERLRGEREAGERGQEHGPGGDQQSGAERDEERAAASAEARGLARSADLNPTPSMRRSGLCARAVAAAAVAIADDGQDDACRAESFL